MPPAFRPTAAVTSIAIDNYITLLGYLSVLLACAAGVAAIHAFERYLYRFSAASRLYAMERLDDNGENADLESGEDAEVEVEWGGLSDGEEEEEDGMEGVEGVEKLEVWLKS
ncbi:hypothetical protein EDC01DRAFT_779963 [Geopyxis carbonaria]|nr:hypothetical protein EDC01DRAFT_779963 [Geopyxis carbonaria]